jgi:hypothetical protein
VGRASLPADLVAQASSLRIIATNSMDFSGLSDGAQCPPYF